MQFKELKPGECFRLTGDPEIMMKVSGDRYLRSSREPITGKLLMEDITTPKILVYPCKCKRFQKSLTREEQEAVDAIVADGNIPVLSQFFERA